MVKTTISMQTVFNTNDKKGEKMDKLTMGIKLNNNKGRLSGKIVGGLTNKFEVEGENFYEGMISVNRLSDVADILPFTISEKLIKAYDLELKEGDEVDFSGELRSYNRLIDGKSRLILSFFVK